MPERANKIFAGPVTERQPQVLEAPVAGGALLPGTVVLLSSGTLIAHNGANLRGLFGVLQENYLASEGTDTSIAVGAVGVAVLPLENYVLYARVATGQNVTKGAKLVSNGSGALIIAAAGVKECLFYAEEAYNNTSGSSQLVRVRPAKETTA